ncbi:MAG: signal peptidase I [Pseudobdellovibrionaceae bacterium]
MKKNLKGTWRQALLAFFGPVLLVVLVRWLFIEPFMIPSGSMLPNLLIHDHIFVNKLSFGIQNPLARGFLVQWSHPQVGDIVVFRFPENPDVFFVKRILAVGGDEISIKNGIVTLNGKALPLEAWTPEFSDESFDYFLETSNKTYLIRYRNKEDSYLDTTKVPEGSFFVIGDNRDQSNDSRFWGPVSERFLIGRASFIWLSCEKTLTSAQFLCDPSTIRWDRLLKKIE